VSVTNLDNDGPGVSVSGISGDTTEAGGQAIFTVVLQSQPSGTVTVALASSDVSEGTVSPDALVFTPANWNTPQTVTVTGVDDDVDDGNVAYIIVTTVSSDDPNYNGMAAADVNVTNTDDDGAATANNYLPLIQKQGPPAATDLVVETIGSDGEGIPDFRRPDQPPALEPVEEPVWTNQMFLPLVNR
jgi:hypothetical protein